MKTPDSRILVVDDHFDFAESLAMQLEQAGYRALPLGSVRDALDALDEDPSVGLVVTDIRMPEVDGLDFRRVLKHRFPKLSVVFMTGLPVDEEDMVPRHVEVLQKPFSLDVLLQAIARLQ